MTLANRQAELVRALVAGAAIPAGFSAADLTATKTALLRKRAGEVGRAWPGLAAAYKSQWVEVFSVWAEQRPPQGSLRDGWDFARAHPLIDTRARQELALREITWRYDGRGTPRRRSAPGRWIKRWLSLKALAR
jgi:hypothetical protein